MIKKWQRIHIEKKKNQQVKVKRQDSKLDRGKRVLINHLIIKNDKDNNKQDKLKLLNMKD